MTADVNKRTIFMSSNHLQSSIVLRVMQKKLIFEFHSGRPLEMGQYVKKICAEISVNLDKKLEVATGL